MSDKEHGKFAYEGLERILHEKARLSIMTSLFTKKEGYCFNDLKELCSLTDGNLSRHIQILKKAGMIEVVKGYEGNKPNTLCKITDFGEKKYVSYVNELEKVIKDAKILSDKKNSVISPDLSKA